MSNKDISQKDLLRIPSVVASLINLLLYDNKAVIRASQIRYIDLSEHFFFDKLLRPVFPDVCVFFRVPNATCPSSFVLKTRPAPIQ